MSATVPRGSLRRRRLAADGGAEARGRLSAPSIRRPGTRSRANIPSPPGPTSRTPSPPAAEAASLLAHAGPEPDRRVSSRDCAAASREARGRARRRRPIARPALPAEPRLRSVELPRTTRPAPPGRRGLPRPLLVPGHHRHQARHPLHARPAGRPGRGLRPEQLSLRLQRRRRRRFRGGPGRRESGHRQGPSRPPGTTRLLAEAAVEAMGRMRPALRGRPAPLPFCGPRTACGSSPIRRRRHRRSPAAGPRDWGSRKPPTGPASPSTSRCRASIPSSSCPGRSASVEGDRGRALRFLHGGRRPDSARSRAWSCCSRARRAPGSVSGLTAAFDGAPAGVLLGRGVLERIRRREYHGRGGSARDGRPAGARPRARDSGSAALFFSPGPAIPRGPRRNSRSNPSVRSSLIVVAATRRDGRDRRAARRPL